ncbi:MAG: hypothetical protein ABL921_07945 [Pirellula sp.]
MNERIDSHVRKLLSIALLAIALLAMAASFGCNRGDEPQSAIRQLTVEQKSAAIKEYEDACSCGCGVGSIVGP